MIRRAHRAGSLALLTLVGLAVAASAAASTSTSPLGTLTQQDPLGHQSLCCRPAPTSPTPVRSAARSHAPVSRQRHRPASGGPALMLDVIAVVLLAGLGALSLGMMRAHARRLGWLAARHRHEIPAARFHHLRPLFRYDEYRDAWLLKGVGELCGPVLRPAIPRTQRVIRSQTRAPSSDTRRQR